jgi:hypothetical protein
MAAARPDEDIFEAEAAAVGPAPDHHDGGVGSERPRDGDPSVERGVIGEHERHHGRVARALGHGARGLGAGGERERAELVGIP